MDTCYHVVIKRGHERSYLPIEQNYLIWARTAASALILGLDSFGAHGHGDFPHHDTPIYATVVTDEVGD